jgi:hypothetical protein
VLVFELALQAASALESRLAQVVGLQVTAACRHYLISRHSTSPPPPNSGLPPHTDLLCNTVSPLFILTYTQHPSSGPCPQGPTTRLIPEAMSTDAKFVICGLTFIKDDIFIVFFNLVLNK